MLSSFYRIMLLRPPRIAGIRLRPFSMWHVLCLQTFGNAFVTGHAPRRHDCIQLLLICRDGKRDHLRTYLHFVNTHWPLIGFALRIMRTDTRKLIEEIGVYVQAFQDLPEIYSSQDGKRSHIPTPFRVVSIVAGYLSLHPDEVWDMSVGEVMSHFLVRLEDDGAVRVDNEAEAEKEQESRAKLAAYLKSQEQADNG